jgi:hypothetical protein
MRGIIITAGATLLVAVPAAMGLVGNTSFAQSVPVRVPAQATLVTNSDSEHATSTTGPRDDKGGPRPTRTPESGDDKAGPRSTGAGMSSQHTTSSTGSGGGTVSDSGSAKSKNGGHGGSSNPTGAGEDGSGHT